MAFVLHSSAAPAWVLPEESNVDADAVFGRLTLERAMVPALWAVEVGNAR